MRYSQSLGLHQSDLGILLTATDQYAAAHSRQAAGLLGPDNPLELDAMSLLLPVI